MEKRQSAFNQTAVILLVEDNAGHAELVKRSLQRHPITNVINHVSNGEAALDYLFQRGGYTDTQQYPRPQLILLDLRLPRVDGLELLKEIKTHEELCSIPVVVLTTSKAESDVVQAYHYHANSYLVKPMDFSKFSKMMEDLGFYWLDWNYQPPHSA